MSQDHLGLFDTPPDRKEIRIGLVLVSVLFASLAVLSTLPDFRLREIDAFIPMVDSIMFLGDAITATLLYVQATVFRSRALTVLASGYVLCALLLVAHALTFPGVFAPDGLLGAGVNTTAWIANFWRATPPIAIILYVALRGRSPAGRAPENRPAARVGVGLFAAIALAAAITLLATLGHDWLPQVFLNRSELNFANFRTINFSLLALVVVALAVLFPKRRSVLDMWLLVALAGWLAHAILNQQSTGRYTVGFYWQFTMLLFSHFVVMLALIAESNRLYARLALSTAAGNREREARLMSMDAVAAAISHEVGQPLSAVITNATGGLNWLKRDEPDPKRAIEALHATVDAGKRATDVVKSIRAMFAREPGSASEFDLNDLARETASLLDREMAGQKVSLRLALDEALPPVVADRVQIQQVLVNLLTNAIESLREAGPPRRIAIRSAPLDEHNVLLEVSDSGIGIAPEAMAQIFQAFFTTKATGTGLGLSLCRTIVEEHGGSLWATPGEKHGATFHLRLPRGGLAAH